MVATRRGLNYFDASKQQFTQWSIKSPLDQDIESQLIYCHWLPQRYQT
ncbi:MAG: hypothetical protein IPK77_16860 [Cellvibrio sp.]|nr:hypothetical protein [Cellvibrio sp.]